MRAYGLFLFRLWDARDFKVLFVIEVETGRVCVGQANESLRAGALGSCIAVILHDPIRCLGVLAHVMLPGAAPASADEPTRYAEDAIQEALRLMGTVRLDRLNACLIGGANVIQNPNGQVFCQLIQESVRGILARYSIVIGGYSLGGTVRRSALIVILTGEVFCALGDGPEIRIYPVNSNEQ